MDSVTHFKDTAADSDGTPAVILTGPDSLNWDTDIRNANQGT